MLPHTRAIVAASAYAFIARKKVAGVHDHSTSQDLQIAAEVRGEHLQGYDGDRSVRFGGAATELYDAGNEGFVSLEIDGLTAQGYDRHSSSHYSLTVTGEMVQLYDHAPEAWFAFSMQLA
jgi:hypothetical protein